MECFPSKVSRTLSPFFLIIFSFRDPHTVSSLVESQSMSPYRLQKWLLSDEAFHPTGNLKYSLLCSCSCCELCVEICDWSSRSPLQGGIGEVRSGSVSLQGSSRSFPSVSTETLVPVTVSHHEYVPNPQKVLFTAMATALQGPRSLGQWSASYTFVT